MVVLLKEAVLVGFGGFVGSVLRYSISLLIGVMTNNHWYPLGTLVVNVLGSFLIGLLAGVFALKGHTPTHIHLFLFVGLLGGFTTFSTFSHETVTMLRNGQVIAMLGHMLIHLLFCIGGAGFGLRDLRRP